MNIYDTIAKKFDEMSKSQKKIASYILQHKAEVSFLNVNNLAQAAQVSEATIIRFALFLGYKGYPQMQKELQVQTQKQLSLRERLDISADAYEDKDAGLYKFFDEENNRLKLTQEALDPEVFFEIVKAIQKAKHVYILAGRSAVSLGYFMSYYLNMMLGNVVLIGNVDSYEELICSLTAQDLVIGLTFSRYTRRTCDLIHFAHERGVPTVSITDYMTSPVIKDSTYYLLAETAMPTYLDSFVAPLTVINALLTYVGRANVRRVDKRMADLEALWDQFHSFV